MFLPHNIFNFFPCNAKLTTMNHTLEIYRIDAHCASDKNIIINEPVKPAYYEDDLMRLVPVVPGRYFNLQGNLQRDNLLHLPFHQLDDGIFFMIRSFKDQFIMNLHDH